MKFITFIFIAIVFNILGGDYFQIKIAVVVFLDRGNYPNTVFLKVHEKNYRSLFISLKKNIYISVVEMLLQY